MLVGTLCDGGEEGDVDEIISCICAAKDWSFILLGVKGFEGSSYFCSKLKGRFWIFPRSSSAQLGNYLHSGGIDRRAYYYMSMEVVDGCLESG